MALWMLAICATSGILAMRCSMKMSKACTLAGMLASLQIPKLDVIFADCCYCPCVTHVLITAELPYSLLHSTYNALDIQYAPNQLKEHT